MLKSMEQNHHHIIIFDCTIATSMRLTQFHIWQSLSHYLAISNLVISCDNTSSEWREPGREYRDEPGSERSVDSYARTVWLIKRE